MNDKNSKLNNDLAKGAEDVRQMVDAALSLSEKEVNVHIAGRKEAVTQSFVMVFHERVLQDLLLTNKLTMTDMKILFGICNLAQFGNLVSLSQSGLADMLGLHKVSVSKSITKLIDLGLIVDTRLGRFLNPAIIVKGKLSGVEEVVWDAAERAGYPSPLRSVARQQAAKKDHAA